MSTTPSNLAQANIYQKRYLPQAQRVSARTQLRSALSEVEIDVVLQFMKDCQDVAEFLHGGWWKVDITLMLLYWMGKHEVARGREMERYFGIPRCTFFRCVEKLMTGVELFNKHNIVWGTIAERLSVAQQTMPANYSHCTGIIDGVHVHIKVCRFFHFVNSNREEKLEPT